MYFNYGLEKMTVAVSTLVTGSGELHERVHAVNLNLMLLEPEKHRLPQKAQSTYREVRNFFKCTGPLDEKTRRPLASQEEYRKIADKICEIAFALYEQMGKSKGLNDRG